MGVENDENISEQLRAEIEIDYADLTPIIYSCLEVSHQVAPEFFRLIVERSNYKGQFPEQAAKINQRLYPSLIRAMTQYLLHIQHINTQVTDPIERLLNPSWECDILSNNGLAGRKARRNYKIFKAYSYRKYSFDEETEEPQVVLQIPPPGHSKRKQAYFKQLHRHQYQFAMDFGDFGKVALPKHNAVYLWDPASSNSIDLYIACPKWCGENYVTTYFLSQVPHPIYAIKPPLQLEELVEDIELPKLNFGQSADLSELDNDEEIEDNNI